MIPGSDKDHPSLVKSFLFAIQGFVWTVKHERNIKIMLAGFAAALILAVALQVDAAGWGVILIGCGVVLCAELLNTAVETVVDLVSPEYHQLAGRAKDIAAAGVWVLSTLVAIAGIVVYAGALMRILN